MRKLLKYLKGYEKETVLAPLFKMLEASFELLVPLVMAAVIDTGIARQDRGCVVRMCLLMVGLGMIGLVCSVTAQYYAAKAATGFSTKLRHALFARIQSFSFTRMDTLGTSTLITRMTSDINQVQSGVNMILRLFLRSPFIVAGAMVMAFTIDKRAALVFAVTIPLLSLAVYGITRASMPLYRRVQAGLDRILGITRENLTGVRVIRAFLREDQETERFEKENGELNRMQRFVGRISALMNPVTYVMINAGVAALIWTGALRVEAGFITQGEVVALINYMSQILVELLKFANLIVTVTKGFACANRVAAVLETQEEGSREQEAGQTGPKDGRPEQEAAWTGPKDGRPGQEAGGAEKSNCQHKDGAASGSVTVRESGTGDGKTAVSFEHVSLTYAGAGAEALTDIDLEVKKGETLGIIGGTGSGKSSLVHLIPRFYEATGGCVRVEGVDVREYSLQELRAKIGTVLQKAVLFKGTVRENLLWGKEDATREELWQALSMAQAKEFVEEKEGGLEAKITQGGKNLSGGQRQRLTIARALVRKPEILILDDSASALDYATDLRLRRALQSMEEKPAVFLVSQRAASVMHADRILVLEDGRMAGLGTHEELLTGCPVYREICESQLERRERA